MELNFFTRRRILKKTNAFDLIPVRRCEFRAEDDGTITLLIPKFKNERTARFMLGNRPRFIQIHLDENGTRVWQEIDGIKSIGAICENLKAGITEELLQIEQRVNKFMTRLYDERYITFRQLEDASKK